tara:strand:- start:678 stop:1022 length:345 start_codon:yes stop_codon:yes gene_type:complete
VDKVGDASMGPCRIGHGKKDKFQAFLKSLMLQWGRAALGTERPAIDAGDRDVAGFNGAVPHWARKESIIDRLGKVVIRLQWGRAALGTESDLIATIIGSRPASMGPCRIGHGKH